MRVLLLLIIGAYGRQSFCKHNTCSTCQKLAFGTSGIARKCHRLLRVPNCCQIYTKSINGALIADTEPNPSLCASKPRDDDFDNGCQFCRRYTNPPIERPVDETDQYTELELELERINDYPDESLCPTTDKLDLNGAIFAPVIVFSVISVLTIAYFLIRRKMRARAELTKSKRKQESVLRRMSTSMYAKITMISQKGRDSHVTPPTPPRDDKQDELIVKNTESY